MQFKKKVSAAVSGFLLSSNIFILSVSAVTSDVITLNEEQDLVVIFNFDAEEPDVTFISPSGEEYTSSDGSVDKSIGSCWASYTIKNAEAGTWQAEYDMQENSTVQYAALDESLGLEISYFEYITGNDELSGVMFLAESELDGVPFTFNVYAVNNETGAYYSLIESDAVSGEETQADIDASRMTDGEYYLQLEAYFFDGESEIYDIADGEVLVCSDETTSEPEEEEIFESSEQEENISEENDEELPLSSENTAEVTAVEREPEVEEEETEDAGILENIKNNPFIPAIVVGIAVLAAGLVFLMRDE